MDIKVMDKLINLRSKHLVLAVSSMAVMSLAHAGENTTEIEQLRQEVKELRTLLNASLQQPAVTLKPQSDVTPQVKTTPLNTSQSVRTNILPSGAEVNLYGYIRADASYQMEGAATMYNNISGVPLKDTVEATNQKDRLRTTVNVTRLGLNFKTPTSIGDIGGKLEMDFFGGSTRDQFRIRHAYLTYDKWLVGQTWSTFVAPEYIPDTVDAATFVGGALQRSPLIRYSDQLSENTNYAISIEDPKYTEATDPANRMRMPALVGRLNHKFADGSTISGRSFIAEKKTGEDEQLAWGIGLGGKYQITPETLLKADYYHVKGDGRFVLWSNSGYAIDENNNMHSNEFDIIAAGITHRFTPKIRSTLGYGYMKAQDDNEFSRLKYDDASQNKQLWQGWINAIYNPYKPVTFGVEYVYGERETFNNRTGVDNRFNMMAIYDF